MDGECSRWNQPSIEARPSNYALFRKQPGMYSLILQSMVPSSVVFRRCNGSRMDFATIDLLSGAIKSAGQLMGIDLRDH
jgi:hypothetical protein